MFIPQAQPNGLCIVPLGQKRSEKYDEARREINYRAAAWDWATVPDCPESRLVRRGLAGYRLTDGEVEQVKNWKGVA